MSPGEVDDVQVVADSGAVRGGVVVAEDAELFPTAHGDLGDERQQVLGLADGIFADFAARMGAHGVEVAQDRYAPVGVGGMQVVQHAFDDELGAGVGALGVRVGSLR